MRPTGILYNFGAMFCKLALLTFYFRIFRPSQISRLVCWCGIALTVVFYTTTSVINLVYCLPRPSDGGWNSPASLTRCDAHQQKLNFAQGIVSSITDFYVLAIPFTMIASLNLSMRRKIGLLGVFLTGLTAAIFSILGTVYRHKAAASVPSDASWYGLTVQALGVAELNLGIICACLPILITLFKRFSETLSAAWKSISTRISSSAGNRGLASAEIANTSPHVTGKVPRGTIEGLSSFIRSFRVPNTQPSEKSFNVDSITDNNTYVELHSLDYEYHAHIEHPGKQTKQRL
ncbi:hypothetical protein RRF57_007689 [Xylaria bambusicola]|uniref:Rhodopsin domain-containing protein n=1 Tax=Xylaria bambusicola TaxID=326684 RepID=A0AAN7UGL2_9PEZI